MHRNARSRSAAAVLAIIALLVGLVSSLVLEPLVTPVLEHGAIVEYLDGKVGTTAEMTASMALAATAIALVPDDSTTPIADQIIRLSSYLLAVTIITTMEKLLFCSSGFLVFSILLPVICLLFAIYQIRHSPMAMKMIIRLAVLCLCLLTLVPASAGLGRIIDESPIMPTFDAIEEQVEEVEGGSLWDQTVAFINRIKAETEKLTSYAKDMLGYYMNCVVVLIISNCIIPILVMLIFIQVTKQIFAIVPLEDMPFIRRLTEERLRDRRSRIPEHIEPGA